MNVRAFIHPGYENEEKKCAINYNLDYFLKEDNIQEIKDELIVDVIKLSKNTTKYMNLGVREPLNIPDVDGKLEKYLEYNEKTKDFIQLTCSRKFGLTIQYLCIPSSRKCINSMDYEDFSLKASKSKNGKCYFKLIKSNKLERIEVTFSTVPSIKFNLELENIKDQKDRKKVPIGSPIQLERNEMTISYSEKYFIWLHKSEGKLSFHLSKFTINNI